MPLLPKLLAIIGGAFFVVRSSWLAELNAAYFRRTYSHELYFPRLWPYFYRVGGLLFMGWGIVMLIRDF